VKTGTKAKLLCKPKIRNPVCLLAKHEVHVILEEGHKLHQRTTSCKLTGTKPGRDGQNAHWSCVSLFWQGDTLGRWFLCDEESHVRRTRTEKRPRYGSQSCVSSTWIDCATLIVATAWLCTQRVNKMLVRMLNRHSKRQQPKICHNIF